MKQTPSASFTFENYSIIEFSFKDLGYAKDGYNIEFNPLGIYDIEKSLFRLTFNFVANAKSGRGKKKFLDVNFNAFFKFTENTSFEEIPDYFYRNAIAIAFPYLRAFVSNITIQANIKPLIIPTLNLSQLEEPFKQNTFLKSIN